MNHQRFQKQRYSQNRKLTAVDRVRFQKLVKLIGKGHKVLDMGCFDGSLSLKIKKNQNQVIGVDISPQAVSQAEKKGIEAIVVNLEKDNLPFENNRFDAVLAAQVIEHVFDTNHLLKEAKRVLKPGGSLIVSTPNTASLGRRLLLLLGKNPYLEPAPHPERAGHLRYFTKGSLVNLLKNHRFEIEKFTSDVVLFSQSGKYHSLKLAKIWPSLGKNLIIVAKIRN